MNRPFSLFVDASNYSVGACLSQTHNNKEKPNVFASSKLTTTELVYHRERRVRNLMGVSEISALDLWEERYPVF